MKNLWVFKLIAENRIGMLITQESNINRLSLLAVTVLSCNHYTWGHIFYVALSEKHGMANTEIRFT